MVIDNFCFIENRASEVFIFFVFLVCLFVFIFFQLLYLTDIDVTTKQLYITHRHVLSKCKLFLIVTYPL